MKTITMFVVSSAIGGLVLVGCSDKSASTTGPSIYQAQFEISPADGATAVRLDASVGLWFRSPMDRAVVERALRLISEKDMADSNCALSTTMAHGTMSDSMADSSMMLHMDQYHATAGTFIWNDDSTLCTFRPDSMMASKIQYMIHLGRELTQVLQSRMGSMAMMGGHGIGAMADDMMFHFSTLDTTQQGGGHFGHH